MPFKRIFKLVKVAVFYKETMLKGLKNFTWRTDVYKIVSSAYKQILAERLWNVIDKYNKNGWAKNGALGNT